VSDPIRRLVQHLARLPGVGEKTATRLAFHMVRSPRQQTRDLAQALLDLADRMGLCSVCANVTEADPCAICADARRAPEVVCVVATPADVVAIDRGGHFRGRYHVLHGLLAPLEGIGPEDLRIADLLRRLGAGSISEVILATAASVEGEATAMYVARLVKPLGITVSRIATGLPVGGELEYADQATISRALAGRAVL